MLVNGTQDSCRGCLKLQSLCVLVQCSFGFVFCCWCTAQRYNTDAVFVFQKKLFSMVRNTAVSFFGGLVRKTLLFTTPSANSSIQIFTMGSELSSQTWLSSPSVLRSLNWKSLLSFSSFSQWSNHGNEAALCKGSLGLLNSYPAWLWLTYGLLT